MVHPFLSTQWEAHRAALKVSTCAFSLHFSAHLCFSQFLSRPEGKFWPYDKGNATKMGKVFIVCPHIASLWGLPLSTWIFLSQSKNIHIALTRV